MRASAIVVLSGVTAFVAAYAISNNDPQHPVTAAPSRGAIPRAVQQATLTPSRPEAAQTAAVPAATGMRAALTPLANAQGFGGRLLARVVDAQTGTVLFDRNGTTPAAPASTGKLLTAAAILGVHEPSDRFTTTVRDAGNGTLVLLGGGDPTLSAAKPGSPTTYAGAARISDLAAQVKAARVSVKRIVVDGSLFPGPSVSPAWDPSDMGTSYGAPITAVMADAAQQPAAYARSGNPDLTAGADLAAALGRPDLPVARGVGPAAARQVASVRSAPLSELVTEMLQTSDNIIAEVLARQVAVALRLPASFGGATQAIRTVLARFGVTVGAGMKDGSGLSSYDRVSPAALVAVLRLIAGYGPPASAQLRFVAAALPVAGWSGTLADRFTAGDERFAAGRVRAKTGTLSTVSSLSGLVRDRSGRLLVYSLDADQVIGTVGADAALDSFVAALARCGCS